MLDGGVPLTNDQPQGVFTLKLTVRQRQRSGIVYCFQHRLGDFRAPTVLNACERQRRRGGSIPIGIGIDPLHQFLCQ